MVKEKGSETLLPRSWGRVVLMLRATANGREVLMALSMHIFHLTARGNIRILL
jgi:hypothetical protein